MRGSIFVALCLLVHPFSTFADVTNVTITSRAVVADGYAFGARGPYERLIGRIEFALDPTNSHNRRIVDLEHAPRAADGRVHFSSDLYVLRPIDPAKANGVLLFEVANRGNKGMLPRFNRDAARSADPATRADFGDGFLMREGYTLVFVGWELGLAAPQIGVSAPPVMLPPDSAVDPIDIDVIVNAGTTETPLVDEPARPPVIYAPADMASPTDRLTVRDLFWNESTIIPRERWRFLMDSKGVPMLHLDGGFEPGRWYRVTYRPSRPVVAGVGLAAIRDAAAAFRYRSDLPVRGRAAYVFGISQTGRFLRQFLYDGFNADESDRRVFDAVWVHIAGAARGSFNERFAKPSQGDMFEPTRFPFADAEETDVDGSRAGLLSRYRPDQLPKAFYTNTPVEYWGGGRAAALTHVSVDGTRDLVLPDHVRMYVLAGAQHGSGPFPPSTNLTPRASALDARALLGQELSNPTPQITVLRALLRALHAWASDAVAPPPSRYPRLVDGTLVRIQDVRFPALPHVADPRRIVGPARRVDGKIVPLPHLVPQVDADGNDLAGIRDPEVAVPLATTTGWNFRNASAGNPGDVFQLLGSYIPFPRTRAVRESKGDPRLSLEERYRGVDDYLQRVRAAAMDLIRDRYMLEEDLDAVLTRARSHWDYATGSTR
jgi:hypothetical protein